ncbi:hypothetical protein COV82_01125 [Candidatus Peregrinibacteria bacterium CG11_big_fil_rev_8_21_14_0_20_46_8]|nr:MAG: hypothetical protein COV82_01125 [Candidatus Peregrinibacteria bacterium CG11_big_fil_rev_8_21_14_0_20_46_8]
MAFFSEIFFSTLIGKPVYTLDDKYFGQFRDFIVRRKKENFVVTKVRIRDRNGKRIIIPWEDIHSIETVPVSFRLKKKRDEIRGIEYAEDEFRVKRDFLDQQIVDTQDHRVVRVNDLRIVSVGNELFVVAADIGFRGLMRRIGFESLLLAFARFFRLPMRNKLIASKDIDPLPARLRHRIQLTVGQDELKNMHPADIADIVEDLDTFERLSILQTLPTQKVADALFELEADARKALVKQLKDEQLSGFLEQMSPDEATDIVAELPKRRMHRVMQIMKRSEAEEIRNLLKFKEGTAGSMMTTEFLAFSGDTTARDALATLRKTHQDAEQIYYLYIEGPNGELTGVVSLRELIFVEPKTQLQNMVKTVPHSVELNDDVDTVIEQFTKYGLIAMPVVDEQNRIQGVITVDDVLGELEEEE